MSDEPSFIIALDSAQQKVFNARIEQHIVSKGRLRPLDILQSMKGLDAYDDGWRIAAILATEAEGRLWVRFASSTRTWWTTSPDYDGRGMEPTVNHWQSMLPQPVLWLGGGDLLMKAHNVAAMKRTFKDNAQERGGWCDVSVPEIAALLKSLGLLIEDDEAVEFEDMMRSER